MFFSQAEKNQKAWALGEKPTAGLSHGERGRRNSLRSNTASLLPPHSATRLPFHRRPPSGYVHHTLTMKRSIPTSITHPIIQIHYIYILNTYILNTYMRHIGTTAKTPAKKNKKTPITNRTQAYPHGGFRRPLSPWLSPSVAFSPSAQAFGPFLPEKRTHKHIK